MTDDDRRPVPSGILNFDFIKSNFFRVIRADGAIGGVTPGGEIHFALYSERHAIPRRVAYRANPDGSLGEFVESEFISRGGVVREMDVDVFMDVPAAESLVTLLQALIKDANAPQESSKARKK